MQRLAADQPSFEHTQNAASSMMMMNNYDKYKISTLQNTIKKNRGVMASGSNKNSSMTVQTLMTNRQVTAGESNNILDLRR